MDDILETIDGNNLAFSAFAGASGDEDFVVFADWN